MILLDPFLPGTAEDLMSAGQFNSEIEILIGTNVDDGMNSLLGALADNSLFDYYQATFNTTAPMQIFDIPFESGIHWIIFTKDFCAFSITKISRSSSDLRRRTGLL